MRQPDLWDITKNVKLREVHDEQISLGSGSYGEVKYGHYIGNKVIPMAIKQARVNDTERFEREVKTWAKMIHPNILPFCGYLKPRTDRPLEPVSPYVPEGTLQECCRTHDLSSDTKRSLIFDAALGLAYLHKKTLVHLDVKASNILVTHVNTGGSSFKLRGLLCDFGYAKDFILKNYNSSSIGRGSLPWQAWEIVAPSAVSQKLKCKDWEKSQFRSQQLPKADVWSWGMTVLEVYTGKQPYHNVPEDEVVDNLRRGKTPSFKVAELTAKGMDSVLMRLMRESWELNPVARKSMQAILDEAKVPSPASVEQDTSEPRTPSDQLDSRGNRILFYARAKVPAWASTDRLRLIEAHEPDELLKLKQDDLIAVTHESPDGWFRGQRFKFVKWKYLCPPEGLREPKPPKTKLHKEPFPFVAHLNGWYKDRTGKIHREGTTAVMIGGPARNPKDPIDRDKMPGSVLEPAESGLFPVHHAKRILGPRAIDLPAGVLYYMTVWCDFDGRNMLSHDAKVNLWFETNDVIAVTDAPPEAPWEGEVVTPKTSRTRLSGTFLPQAVEVEYLAS
ncbi:kinase-like protein [Punctularia strigosozonata HHB-11173 SS5]|uniref:kinase-like protein n=1 Tax=Punctularia strigosozonata (strain HHB-11173) TaxID=741275 RepID=UPI0004416391|nr:kinase-like protein [Punctularia strigosozonata HHB-11173 SS5]EIN06244.1 kinase-like protein [Punctularia strigosozonata HHB-11173 SS5]